MFWILMVGGRAMEVYYGAPFAAKAACGLAAAAMEAYGLGEAKCVLTVGV